MLVKVEAASINPFDWKAIQKGLIRIVAPSKLPHTPGATLLSSLKWYKCKVCQLVTKDKNFSTLT